jgi:dipeptidyl aminopeptidase/acylaminoacyl peptidase
MTEPTSTSTDSTSTGSTSTDSTSTARAYADLDAYLALPRVSGLALSPDGARLVTTVATLDRKRTRHVTGLWEVDPTGGRPAARLTRSAKGEGGPVFTPDGDVLFTSARPGPDGDGDDEAPPALWRLPHRGEAGVLATRPGGIGSVVAAKQASRVAVLSDTLPASTDAASDEARRKARKDAKVDAVLHTGFPVRYWDADLGPGSARLLTAELPAGDGELVWRDLTPSPGAALHGAQVELTPDGRTAVLTWGVAEPRGSRRMTLVAIDTGSGERRVLADDGSSDAGDPRVSPDGRQVAVIVERRSTPSDPPDQRLVVLPLDGSGEQRDVAPGWDRWVGEHRWSPDGAALLVAADDLGRRPVFRIELGSGAVTRLTGDAGCYTDLCVAPDGGHVYALRNAVDAAPAPVRLDARTPDQAPVMLLGPETAPTPPGRLVEVTATAADGTQLRSWLVLPEGPEGGPAEGPAAGSADGSADGSPEGTADASEDGAPVGSPGGAAPHPLLLWVHGGPLGSWNGWSWRWNPWLMAARGYAVLLPDPALSTGYGLDFVRRGWGAWGDAPYTDLMTITDAALEHPAVDPARTAVMGGSFGGYMANWIAGHTGRFRAVVTHASLWDLQRFGPTTDAAYYWSREMTPQMAQEHSPSRYADAITSPVLVIHGDKDYRVPIGEGLALWWELCSRAEDPQTMPHRFLYFPNEHHWVLAPQHAKLWYQTVTAFLGVHVLDQPWVTPDLLE